MKSQSSITDSDPYFELEWVFGYGSLMWNPGFPFVRRESACLKGYHRSFCIYSHHYRGSPETPGLVLGLDEGGTCEGVAFQVSGENWSGVVEYLNERELIGYAYQPAELEVQLTSAHKSVQTYTFVADPTHPTYAGDLGLEKTAKIIMGATGAGGLNRDYLINSIHQLEEHGYRESGLHALLERVELLTGYIDQGGGI